MKTAADAIAVLQTLPAEEVAKVRDYLLADTPSPQEDYSEEDIQTLLQVVKDLDNGVNIETHPSMSAACKSLGLRRWNTHGSDSS